ETLLKLCDELRSNLILTTGETGSCPDDITPEFNQSIDPRPEYIRVIIIEWSIKLSTPGAHILVWVGVFVDCILNWYPHTQAIYFVDHKTPCREKTTPPFIVVNEIQGCQIENSKIEKCRNFFPKIGKNRKVVV
ncbi:unnamed protein product, partial [Rotaria magnacalcarata]